MITRAEELFNIPIRKIWGQIVTELVGQRNLEVALACLGWPLSSSLLPVKG